MLALVGLEGLTAELLAEFAHSGDELHCVRAVRRAHTLQFGERRFQFGSVLSTTLGLADSLAELRRPRTKFAERRVERSQRDRDARALVANCREVGLDEVEESSALAAVQPNDSRQILRLLGGEVDLRVTLR